MNTKLDIFCNNKMCPFKDCERRIDRVRSKKKREQATQIDMQCTCHRYTQYLADELNQIMRNTVGQG